MRVLLAERAFSEDCPPGPMAATLEDMLEEAVHGEVSGSDSSGEDGGDASWGPGEEAASENEDNSNSNDDEADAADNDTRDTGKSVQGHDAGGKPPPAKKRRVADAVAAQPASGVKDRTAGYLSNALLCII